MPFIRSLLFPQENSCHLCGSFPDTGLLCKACMKELLRLRIREETRPPAALMHACMAAFTHEGVARQMVHRLKYQHDPALAAIMGEHMAVSLGSFRADAVVPVPLYPKREEERGYNQAELLAREVCSHTGLACDAHAIIRLRSTDSQVGRTRGERLHAMRGAFTVPEPVEVQGKCILLVDDVLTTGATAIACAEALVQAGAQQVSLLVFGRTEL